LHADRSPAPQNDDLKELKIFTRRKNEKNSDTDR